MHASYLLRYGWVAVFLLAIGVPVSTRADDEQWIDLSGGNLEPWVNPTGDWFVAGSAAMNPQNPKVLTTKPGHGVLVNGPKGRTRNLLSKQKFGDIEVHLEFLIPQRSNSGVKFEGLYEIQICDSHGVQQSKANDCGGIRPDGTLANKRLFCKLGSDGMTLDDQGNVYLTGKGVTVFDREGKQIEHIAVDEPWTANVCFGGKDRQTLFITASKSLYGLRLRVKGVGSQ